VPVPDSGVMHLLRKCPVPVWMMRPSQARKLRILALVDPDPEDPVRNRLNDLVLELATSLTHHVARTGLSGLIMGNTAETILGSVRCSVLAVKPQGFVTPVKPARPAKTCFLGGES